MLTEIVSDAAVKCLDVTGYFGAGFLMTQESMICGLAFHQPFYSWSTAPHFDSGRYRQDALTAFSYRHAGRGDDLELIPFMVRA
jgi:hypothetical protein